MAKRPIRQSRANVLDVLSMLASAHEQRQYEQRVPHAAVVDELIEQFVTDVYHPRSPEFVFAFTDAELKDLAELFGRLRIASGRKRELSIGSVAELQKLPEWRAVMCLAKRLEDAFRRA